MLLTVCLSSIYIWTDTEHGRQIAMLFVLGESGSEHVQYEQRKHDFEGWINCLFDRKYDSPGWFDYLLDRNNDSQGWMDYLYNEQYDSQGWSDCLFDKNMILRVGSITYLTVSWKL